MTPFWVHAPAPSSGVAGRHGEPLVWLNPHYAPASAAEQRLAALLAGGPLPLSELIERLAVQDVYADYVRGTWSLAVGAEALPVLRSEWHAALQAADGYQIALETPLAVRAAAASSWQLLLAA